MEIPKTSGYVIGDQDSGLFARYSYATRVTWSKTPKVYKRLLDLKNHLNNQIVVTSYLNSVLIEQSYFSKPNVAVYDINTGNEIDFDIKKYLTDRANQICQEENSKQYNIDAGIVYSIKSHAELMNLLAKVSKPF